MKNKGEVPALTGKRNALTGKYLKDARKKRGISQASLALILGVCERTIKDWEKRGIPERGMARTHNVIKDVLLID